MSKLTNMKLTDNCYMDADFRGRGVEVKNCTDALIMLLPDDTEGT